MEGGEEREEGLLSMEEVLAGPSGAGQQEEGAVGGNVEEDDLPVAGVHWGAVDEEEGEDSGNESAEEGQIDTPAPIHRELQETAIGNNILYFREIGIKGCYHQVASDMERQLYDLRRRWPRSFIQIIYRLQPPYERATPSRMERVLRPMEPPLNKQELKKFLRPMMRQFVEEPQIHRTPYFTHETVYRVYSGDNNSNWLFFCC